MKTLKQKHKQLEEHDTAELGFLLGDLGELRDHLNEQVIILATVEKSVSNVEEIISNEIFEV